MDRRGFLGLIAGLAAAAGPALAEAPLDRVLADLRRLGYEEVTVTSTLLGRTRVFAEAEGATREIILNPRTGEILRDLWLPKEGSGKGSGRLTGSDDDDDDADGGEDDGGKGRGRGRGRGGDDD